MKELLVRTVVVSACVLSLSFAANAQKRDLDAKKSDDSAGVAVMKGTGKAAVIIVGTAGKIAWKATKFTAKRVAKPIVVKAAPKAAKFILKKSIKHLLPFAVKLSIL